MDLSTSIIPKSDQLNADDLMAGPITVTIAEVKQGSAEQPVDVVLVEYPGRAYRPSKSMRRVMVACWGAEASTYKGRQLTLYRNPDIKFGGVAVGGIEISHASHIEKPLTIALTRTRGTRKDFTVQPIKARDWEAELKAAGDSLEMVTKLGHEAKAAHVDPAQMALISERYFALGGTKRSENGAE